MAIQLPGPEKFFVQSVKMEDASNGQPVLTGTREISGGDIKPPRNRTKARVRKIVRNGCELVIKDFSHCSLLIKNLYGRYTLHREARAYELLKGIAGIPGCFGLEGRYCLVIKDIPGRLLGSFKRGELKADVFDRLDAIVAQAHARGVAFGDVHKSNIIITAEGDVFIIDFANAFFARDPGSPGLFMRLVMELDRHAAQRMRARYLRLAAPVPTGLFGFLYRLGRGMKAVLKRIKKSVRQRG